MLLTDSLRNALPKIRRDTDRWPSDNNRIHTRFMDRDGEVVFYVVEGNSVENDGWLEDGWKTILSGY